MKRRLISLLLAAILLMGTLSGCSGQTETTEPATQEPTTTESVEKTEPVEEQGKMAPGSYTAYATGFSLAEPLEVTVTVSEDAILEVAVNPDNAETPPVFQAALAITEDIVENQSVNVDVICGATLSSAAIRLATETALKEALVAGGSSETDMKQFRTAPVLSTETEIVDVDVVVVGMGAAGLSAMTRAAEIMQQAGTPVSVLAIEQQAYYGGNSLMASDFFAVNPERHVEAYNDGHYGRRRYAPCVE